MLTDVQRMDVLFVRWFGLDSIGGWRAQRMHSLGFLPDTDALGPAFGFLDPNEVIRMVHLIPDFVSGRTHDLFMRYRGGGVGHLGTRQCNKILLADEHAPPDTLEIVEPARQSEDQGSNSEGEASGGEDNGDPDEIREDDNEGDQGGNDDGGDLDEGVDGEEQNNNDDEIVAASNDSGIVTAAGFAAL